MGSYPTISTLLDPSKILRLRSGSRPDFYRGSSGVFSVALSVASGRREKRTAVLSFLACLAPVAVSDCLLPDLHRAGVRTFLPAKSRGSHPTHSEFIRNELELTDDRIA